MTLLDRLCAKAVAALGARVTLLNHLPLGRWIVARYHARHAAVIYGDVAAIDTAHQGQSRPPRNVAFCKVVADASPGARSVLEVGAGRAANANILAELLPEANFTLVDAHIDGKRYADHAARCRSIVGDVDAVPIEGDFDVGLTRAFLSILSPGQAERTVRRMAACCRVLVFNESAAAPERSLIRPDRRFAHPYARWLDGWSVSATSSGDPAYDAVIVARKQSNPKS